MNEPTPPPEADEPPAAASPANAFSEPFLRRRRAQDEEPDTAAEAETAGPCTVVPVAEGFAVYLDGDTPANGARPIAVVSSRHVALYAASLLPLLGREPAFTLRPEEESAGFPLLHHGEAAGHLGRFDTRLVAAMNLADALARQPRSLSLLLGALSSLGLERAGRLLAEGDDGL
jgi:hypothetical protein